MAQGAASRENRRARRAGQGLSKAPTTTPTTKKTGSLKDAFKDGMDSVLVASADTDSDSDSDSDTASDRRPAVLAALAAAGEKLDAPGASLATTYEMSAGGTLSERKFFEAVLDAGYSEQRRASWPCEAELADHGEVLFRHDHGGVFRLDDGAIVEASISHGWAYVRAAAPSRDLVAGTLAMFSSTYPPLYRSEDDAGTVPITFWTYGRFGPQSRLRMLDASPWAAIAENYAAGVRAELERLVGDDFEPGKGGQLHLWQGPPGTGKTWALRALASEWREWAECHYITDPDAFFVTDPSYMIDVLLHETYEELMPSPVEGEDSQLVTSVREGGKWRVLILEDTGELLSANAKTAYGQGLSRLLNVVDGMVGQGLKVLALITTNDELGDLHPAAVRPGRCASQLEFGPLSPDEANAWARSRFGDDAGLRQIEAPATLAELYALASDGRAAFQEIGECDCAHMADEHDPLGEGACTVEGCDCEAFTPREADEGPDGTTSEDADSAEESLGEVAIRDTETGETAAVFRLSFDRLSSDVLAAFDDVTREGLDEALDQARAAGKIPMGLIVGTFAEAAELPEAMLPRDERPDPTTPSPAAPLAPVNASAMRWTATFCPEGVPTDDGRMFAEGSISWRELPLTLMAMLETADGHDGAHVCGRIDAIWREGNMIRASGVFDESHFGREIARMVAEGVLRGVSVDIAVREYEVRYEDADGNLVEPDEADMVDVLFADVKVMLVVTDGVIGATTVCPFPAFEDASIEVESSLVASAQSPAIWTFTHQAAFVVVHEPPVAVIGEATGVPLEGIDVALGETAELVPSLTASAAGLVPVQPPADWFANPELEELMPLVVTPDGRVYGHAAAWDTCHIGIPDVCTTAPSSECSYAYFHLGEIECDDGSTVHCGKVTLETGHADAKLGWKAAASHYDNTGCVVAHVVAGEDEYGIWVAGALHPEVDAVKVRELRAAVLSGDWRNINGHLELVALLACNVPGFPIPRPRALVAAGVEGQSTVLALVAAGTHDGTEAFLSAAIAREKIAALGSAATGELGKLAARARAAAPSRVAVSTSTSAQDQIAALAQRALDAGTLAGTFEES